jgi:hypothetical protein
MPCPVVSPMRRRSMSTSMARNRTAVSSRVAPVAPGAAKVSEIRTRLGTAPRASKWSGARVVPRMATLAPRMTRSSMSASPSTSSMPLATDQPNECPSYRSGQREPARSLGEIVSIVLEQSGLSSSSLVAAGRNESCDYRKFGAYTSVPPARRAGPVRAVIALVC